MEGWNMHSSQSAGRKFVELNLRSCTKVLFWNKMFKGRLCAFVCPVPICCLFYQEDSGSTCAFFLQTTISVYGSTLGTPKWDHRLISGNDFSIFFWWYHWSGCVWNWGRPQVWQFRYGKWSSTRGFRGNPSHTHTSLLDACTTTGINWDLSERTTVAMASG